MTAPLSFPIDLTPDYAVENRLEELWEHEAKCEWEHSKLACLGSVAYRCHSTCDDTYELWCTNAYGEVLATAAFEECILCERALLDCWKVQPA